MCEGSKTIESVLLLLLVVDAGFLLKGPFNSTTCQIGLVYYCSVPWWVKLKESLPVCLMGRMSGCKVKE